MSNENKKTALPKLRFTEFQGAEEWVEKSFDQLFTIGSGRDYKHLEKGDIPMYGSGGYMHSVNDYLYEGESVCIGRKGTIDKPMFLSGKFWTVDTLFYTHTFQSCLPKFIYLIFQSVEWLKHNEAGGIPSLSKTIINALKTYVPSLPEQQKIANCFSSLDDLLTAQNSKLEALKAHKRGLMQGFFPAEGETVPMMRFPEFQGADEWEKKQLKDVCSIFQGFAFSSGDSAPNGTRWLKIADVDIQQMNPAAPSFLPETFKEIHKRYLVKKGDYVMALTRPILGNELKISCIDDIFDGALLNQRVGKLVTSSNVTFVYYLLQTSNVISTIKKNIAGSEPPNLSAQHIDDIEVSIPNRAEQQKIADCLSSLDNHINAQSHKIEVIKLHKKGLMQSLFPTSH